VSAYLIIFPPPLLYQYLGFNKRTKDFARFVDLHYDQVLKNPGDSAPEIIKLALDALDVKVYASNERVKIQGVIPPLELLTTGETSACMCFYRNIRS
jgi:hypothetical protein